MRTATIVAAVALAILAGCENESPLTPEQQLAKARALGEGDNPAQAAIEYKNVLQRDPGSVQARLELARLYLRFGDGLAAEKELLAVAQTTPPSVTAVDLAQARLLARELEELAPGNADRSLADIAGMEGLTPSDDARLKALHGHAFLSRGMTDDARAMIDAALAGNPADAYAMLGQAMLAERGGDRQGAIAELARIHSASPDFAPAWSYSGDLARAAGDQRAAETSYTRAIELRRNHAYDLYQRALTRIVLNDYAGARDDARRLDPLARRGAEPHYIRGLAAFQEKDYQAADQYLQSALQADGSYMPAVLFSGLTAAALGNLEQASEQLRRYTASVPHSSVALTQLASVLARLGDYGQARAALEQALSVAPNDTAALELLGTIDYVQGRPDQAGLALARLVEQAPDSADAHRRFAAALLAEGKTQAARQALETAAKLDAQDETDPAARVRTLMSQGKPSAALDAAEAWAREQPSSAAFFMLGQVRSARKEYKDASSAMARALELEPSHPQASVEQGRLQLILGTPAAAEPLLRQAVTSQPKNVTAALLLADALSRLGRTPEAVAVLEETIVRNPTAWQPRLILARYYRTTGDPGRAVSALSAIPEKRRDNPLILEQLGQAQLAAGTPAPAVATFERLVRLAPESAVAHYRLAEALSATRAYDRAKQALDQAVRLDPQLPEPKIAAARMALAAQDVDAAGPLIEALAELQPENPDVQQLIGALAMARKDFRGAVQAYSAALERAQTSGLAVALAMARLAGGDRDGAISGLESWLANHPDDNGARLSLGNLALMTKRADVAKREYLALIERRAGSAAVRNNLAAILLAEGDMDRALGEALEALRLNPQNHQIRDSIGQIYLARKDPERALEYFNQALAVAPGEPAYLLHKAIALESLDRFADAEATVAKIEQTAGDSPVARDAKAIGERLRSRSAASPSPAVGH